MTFIEWLEQSWVYVTALIGIVTLLWGFKKIFKEIKTEVTKPISTINENITNINNRLNVQDEAIQSILKKDIMNLSEKSIKQGYITVRQKETLHSLYKAYKDEHGNSFIDALIEDVNDLDVKA